MRRESKPIDINEIPLPKLERSTSDPKTDKNDDFSQFIFIKSIFPNLHETRYGIATNLGFSVFYGTSNKLDLNFKTTHKSLSVY